MEATAPETARPFTFVAIVDIVGVVTEFVAVGNQRALLRFVHSRWNMAFCDTFRAVRCRMSVSDGDVAALVVAYPELRHVDLYCCENLSVAGLRSLSALGALEKLRVGGFGFRQRGDYITDEALLAMSRLPTLTSLDLALCTHFSNVGLEALACLQRLSELCLSFCGQIDGASIAVLARFPALKILKLHWTDRTKPPDIGALVGLTDLDLHCQSTMDFGVGLALACGRLTSLKLGGVLLSPEKWQPITRLAHTRLTSLSLVHVSAGFLSGCDALQSLECLTSLQIGYTSDVDDATLESVGRLHRLIKLRVDNAPTITSDGIRHLRGLQALESLACTNCRGVDDAALAAIAEMRALRTLDISACPRVTFVGVGHLTALTNLTELILDGAWKLTDDVFAVVGTWPRLRVLSVVGCSRLTDRGLKQLLGAERLWSVRAQRCDGITTAGTALAKALKPHLVVDL